MTIYELHEFDTVGIETGKIQPDLTVPVKYNQYPTSSVGTILIDTNSDLSNSRNLINLFSKKASQNAFNRVVKTEFEEFLDRESVAALEELQTRFDALIDATKAMAPETPIVIFNTNNNTSVDNVSVDDNVFIPTTNENTDVLINTSTNTKSKTVAETL